MSGRKTERINSELIKNAIRAKGLSPNALGNDLGHSTSYISCALSKGVMPMAEIRALCMILDLQLEDVLAREDEPQTESLNLDGVLQKMDELRQKVDVQTSIILDMGKLVGTMVTILRGSAEEAQKSYVSVNSMLNKIYNHMKYSQKGE